MSPTYERSLRCSLLALFAIAAVMAFSPQSSAQDLPGGILPDRPKSSFGREPSSTPRPKPKPKPKPKPPSGSVDPDPEPEPEPEPFEPTKEALEHYKLARAAYDRNNLEKAVTEYEAAIRIDNRYLDALIELGSVYYDLSDTSQAMKTWERALFLDDEVPELHNNIANASFVVSDYERAVREYKRAIELRPLYYDALFGLGNTLMAMKRYGEAVPYFQQAIEARGTPFPDAWSNMAWALLRAGQKDEAEAAARRAIEVWGDNKEESVKAWYALASVLNDKSEFDGSADALRHAIDACSGCPSSQTARIYFSLAQVLEANGQKGPAADALDEYLRLAPFVTNEQDVRQRIADLRRAASGGASGN